MSLACATGQPQLCHVHSSGWHDVSEQCTGLGAHPLKWKTNVPVCMQSLAFSTPSVSCVRLYRSCSGNGVHVRRMHSLV